MRKLAIFLLFLCSAVCLVPTTRAQTVSATWNFSNYVNQAGSVSRVTITPLGQDATYNGAVLIPDPIIFTRANNPGITNGSVTTNVLTGFAYRVDFAGFAMTSITNEFPTNVAGLNVNAVDYITDYIFWQNGQAVYWSYRYPNGATTNQLQSLMSPIFQPRSTNLDSWSAVNPSAFATFSQVGAQISAANLVTNGGNAVVTINNSLSVISQQGNGSGDGGTNEINADTGVGGFWGGIINIHANSAEINAIAHPLVIASTNSADSTWGEVDLMSGKINIITPNAMLNGQTLGNLVLSNADTVVVHGATNSFAATNSSDGRNIAQQLTNSAGSIVVTSNLTLTATTDASGKTNYTIGGINSAQLAALLSIQTVAVPVPTRFCLRSKALRRCDPARKPSPPAYIFRGW